MPRNIKNRQPVPSEAHDESYAPNDVTDWSTVPNNVGDALDELVDNARVATGTTDDTLARWDGTTGDRLQGSGIVLNDDDSLGAVKVQVADPADTETVVTGAAWLQIS